MRRPALGKQTGTRSGNIGRNQAIPTADAVIRRVATERDPTMALGAIYRRYAARGCDYARAAENRRQHAELATFPGERRRHRLSVFPATSLSARQSELVDGSG